MKRKQCNIIYRPVQKYKEIKECSPRTHLKKLLLPIVHGSSQRCPVHPGRQPRSQTPLNLLQPWHWSPHVALQLSPYRPVGHSKFKKSIGRFIFYILYTHVKLSNLWYICVVFCELCYLYYTYCHKHQRHIQIDNFRLRDDTAPLFYSFHTPVYIPHHMFCPHIL